MRITESIRTDRRPEAVWAVVSDASTHTTWRPALREFRQVSEGPLQVGSRLREVLGWRGRVIELEDVVTALDPPRRLALRGSWKAADFELDLRLQADGDGTLIEMDWSLHPRSALMRLASPFLGPTMRRATRDELEQLKALVEQGG